MRSSFEVFLYKEIERANLSWLADASICLTFLFLETLKNNPLAIRPITKDEIFKKFLLEST